MCNRSRVGSFVFDSVRHGKLLVGCCAATFGLVVAVAACAGTEAPLPASGAEPTTTAAPPPTSALIIPLTSIDSVPPLATTPVSSSTSVAGSVVLVGSGNKSSNTFALGAGDYLIEWRHSGASCGGYAFRLIGADHNENPLRKLGGGSSPDGLSGVVYVRGGEYKIQVFTCDDWRFTAVPV